MTEQGGAVAIQMHQREFRATKRTILVKKHRWVLYQRCESEERAAQIARQLNASEARTDGLFVNWERRNREDYHGKDGDRRTSQT